MGFFSFGKKKKKEIGENQKSILSDDSQSDEIQLNESQLNESNIDENQFDDPLEAHRESPKIDEVFDVEKISDSDSFNDENSQEEIPQEKIPEEETLEQEYILQQEEESDTQGQSKPKGIFRRLVDGLSNTRKSLLSGLDRVFKSFTSVEEELFEELEEALIMGDVGVNPSMEIISRLRDRVKEEKEKDVLAVKNMLTHIISEILIEGESDVTITDESKPTVILIVGVNGVGKTTTIGKLANQFESVGKKTIIAAADTFRAAAIDQLEVWSKRAGSTIIKHQQGGDPGAVVFDAIAAARARKADILLCDTAGRLQNKKNLMDELGKINKIIDSQFPEANKEIYIVLDATAGQNSLQQVKIFNEVCNITGIVLTKLDGTAKGGIIIAIKSELKVPVKYIGVGEKIDDLQPFDAQSFANALFMS